MAVPHRYATFAPSVLHDADAESWNALFGPPINAHRASIELPPVDDVRELVFTGHPGLAADPDKVGNSAGEQPEQAEAAAGGHHPRAHPTPSSART